LQWRKLFKQIGPFFKVFLVGTYISSAIFKPL
jgi:hypothetical protein